MNGIIILVNLQINKGDRDNVNIESLPLPLEMLLRINKLVLKVPLRQESGCFSSVFLPPCSSSFVPPPLHHLVPLPAGGRQRHRPREHDGNRRLNVPLQEVEDGVPPRPRQVVVGSLTQRLSRNTQYNTEFKLCDYGARCVCLPGSSRVFWSDETRQGRVRLK